ncbi:CCA tRNA nucleotidyltransferase [Breznakiellaceae bacterium SP9]
MNKQVIDPLLKEVGRLFSEHGKQVYLVGGSVRDMFLNRQAKDWDLATDALPEELTQIFEHTTPPTKVIPTGIKHGTVTVLYWGTPIEITTFRTEADYKDGRHPETVHYTRSIEEDLSRRDFTMNAIARKLPDGGIVDPFNGEADIKARTIRCVGTAEERFAEDGLRPLRSVRFASQLDFKIEEATFAAISGALDTCAKVSNERIRDELDKMLLSPKPAAGFLLMEKAGLMRLLLPELSACRGVEQKGHHCFDVLDHSLLACDYASRRHYPREIALAALLHDIGKPTVREMGKSGVWTFYNHEKESARLARALLFRLKYPNVVIDTVVHLIEEHMFHYDDEWTNAAVRRFVIRTGEEYLPSLYCLRFCDCFGTRGEEPPADLLLDLTKRVDAVLKESRSLSLKDLAIGGKDLLAIGVKPGKVIGSILNELLETVLEDPECNTREVLLGIAGKLWERYCAQSGNKVS